MFDGGRESTSITLASDSGWDVMGIENLENIPPHSLAVIKSVTGKMKRNKILDLMESLHSS